LATLATSTALAQPFPAGYPADYARTVEAAKKEGVVVVYSTLDSKAAAPLLRDFAALHPDIKVEYNDINSTEMYNRFIAESASKQGSADVLWNTAMDQSVKLVDQGLAMTYVSPEAKSLPSWAIYKNQAYGTTFEPVGFIYNKRLVPANEVPQDHAAFVKLLATKADKYKNKVTSWDIEKSGTGFLMATQDRKYFPQLKDLVKELGAANVRTFASSGNMLEKTSSGELVLGYNALLAYAYAKARKDPSLGVVFPKDFAHVYSRVMFIGKDARNVNAAKVFVDYVLSQRGQTVIANQAELFSIRDDVPGEHTAGALKKQYGDVLKPIPLSAETAEYLDAKKRLEFLDAWKGMLAGK
jgi:iron(III) transport system substrate-binding protein